MLLLQLLKDDITLIEAQTCFNLLLERIEQYFGGCRPVFFVVGFAVILYVLVSLSIFSFEVACASTVFIPFALIARSISDLICLSQSKKINNEFVPNGST